jgi:hypothetical protein
MERKLLMICFTFMLLGINQLFAQLGESPIKIFGYFQNEFEYQKGTGDIYEKLDEEQNENSFVLQQLNLFFQKDLGQKWTALVNFEIINSFSSLYQRGGFRLEEAWARYRASRQFNIKLGLQIPIFNNLNEIKNRTPLMPYIIRPLAYETAFSEDIPVEEYTPSSAYIQVYGFIPSVEWKFDYAVYLGNTPNIESFSGSGRSGLDTTSSVLIGGRLGIRYQELKLGISATRDIVNYFENSGWDTLLNISPNKFKEVQRVRFGGDLSFNYGNFTFESEYIRVTYDYDISGFNSDRKFYYATLGYHATEKLFLFLSYWSMTENWPPYTVNFKNKNTENLKIITPNIGVSFSISDRIILKAHYAPVQIRSSVKNFYPDRKFHFWATAVSVFF